MWTSRDDYNLLILNGAMPMDAGMWTGSAADVHELAEFASRAVWAHDDDDERVPAAVMDGGRARWSAAQIEARMVWLRASFVTDAERDAYVRELVEKHASETVCDAGGVWCCHGDARSGGEAQPACGAMRFVDRHLWSARAYAAVHCAEPALVQQAARVGVAEDTEADERSDEECDACAARAHSQMCRRCIARNHAAVPYGFIRSQWPAHRPY
jgi:hypothetical protein